MIELGDKVKDKVSGFTGIAIGVTKWLHGCNRIIVQPVVGKDGKYPDNASFDEPQLEVVSKKKVPKGDGKTGGSPINIKEKNLSGR